MTHPDPSSFEQYVGGYLKPVEAESLERHCLECPTCAQLLEREAQLEVQLDEASARLGSSADEGPGRKVKWLWAAVPVGVAASVCLVWLGQASPRPSAPPPAPLAASASTDLLGSRVDAIAIDGIDDRMDTAR